MEFDKIVNIYSIFFTNFSSLFYHFNYFCLHDEIGGKTNTIFTTKNLTKFFAKRRNLSKLNIKPKSNSENF
jgi:hypothetical protein